MGDLELLKLLENAIDSEKASQKSYSMAASIAKDEKIKKIFLQLLEDEMAHESILTQRYLEIKKAQSSKNN